ncbi:galactokinase [Pedobacter frigiditerrae]|uniref:Galactokinase n=1 Tax=Pedobacter frigiditerrae TaxID=2530452 RepID=A0A4V2MIS5_9SPHI|nr:galactokinase [Pedobacter frigiditerrae]TCC91706.1 galactokinase [Pedobacter frigiditerrae]
MIIESIKSAFKKHFNRVPIIVRSPGKINLIGEYTDGYVLPAAIDIVTYVAVSRRSDDDIHLYSESYSEAFQGKLSDLNKTEKDWINYILGIADQLQKWGYHIGGFNLYIDGDVPFDDELSSSAAVECATAYALIELFSLSVPKLDVAKIAQMAEKGFKGGNGSIIDQFTSVFGKKGNAILLDCKNLCHEHIPLKLDGYQLVLLNANLEDSTSTIRLDRAKEQCEQGLLWIKSNVTQVVSLQDTSLKMLDKYVKGKDVEIYKKCKFIVEENQRVLLAAEHLKNANLKGFGQVMFQTHDGLSELYQVSCNELDFLVNTVKKIPYVLGARMMGEGFDGCILNIVKEERIDDFIEELTQVFEDEFSKKLDAYVVEIENGTALIL